MADAVETDPEVPRRRKQARAIVRFGVMVRTV